MCSLFQCLRQVDLSDKIVEFFGPGVSKLSVLERTTIANMCPQYHAVAAFFPVDSVCLEYIHHSGYCFCHFSFHGLRNNNYHNNRNHNT